MSKPDDWPSLTRNKRRKPPYAWIQWKGTSVCMDVYCTCGNPLHVDADFCYHIRCAYCGQVYECSGYIDLIPLDHCPEYTITVTS